MISAEMRVTVKNIELKETLSSTFLILFISPNSKALISAYSYYIKALLNSGYKRFQISMMMICVGECDSH
jgi:hypothetical protein